MTKQYPSSRISQRSWDELFESLKDFQKTHGHCQVPLRYVDTGLGLWVSKLKNEKRPELTEVQARKLEDIGFDWETKRQKDERIWKTKCAELKEYVLEHKTFKVNFKTHKALYAWTTHQRALQSKDKLKEDRKAALDEIGFDWKTPEEISRAKERKPCKSANDRWYKTFQKLLTFKEEHGHCIVPTHYAKDRQLASWVHRQRYLCRNDDLSEERKIDLHDAGFVFSVDAADPSKSLSQTTWDNRFQLLEAYKKEHGTVDIPNHIIYQQVPLGSWIRTQRAEARRGIIDSRRLDALRAIGVSFAPQPATWESNFQRLKAYHKEHGHCKVAKNFANQRLLGWIQQQSHLAKMGDLTVDQKDRLEALGFQFQYGVANQLLKEQDVQSSLGRRKRKISSPAGLHVAKKSKVVVEKEKIPMVKKAKPSSRRSPRRKSESQKANETNNGTNASTDPPLLSFQELYASLAVDVPKKRSLTRTLHKVKSPTKTLHRQLMDHLSSEDVKKCKKLLKERFGKGVKLAVSGQEIVRASDI